MTVVRLLRFARNDSRASVDSWFDLAYRQAGRLTMTLLWLANLAVAFDYPLVAGETFERERTANVEFLR